MKDKKNFLMRGVLALLLISGLTLTGCSNGTTDTVATSTYSADVIVVGAGGSGMTAAIHAAKGGASVIILEKSSVPGGNTILTGSGMNALTTGDQADIDAFIANEKMAGAGAFYPAKEKNPLPNPALSEFMVRNSISTLQWLKDDTKLTFAISGGNNSRTYAPTVGNFAQTVLPLLYEKILSNNRIHILFNMWATELLTDNSGTVTGVSATDTKGNKLAFTSNAVILATGGFGQDYARVATIKPAYAGMFTTAEMAPTTGDGLDMAQAIGADVVDLDQIQINQVVELRSHGNINYGTRMGQIPFIFVNKEAKRFSNERLQGSQVELEPGAFPEAVMKQTDHIAYFIFNETAKTAASTLREFYDRGLVKKGDSLSDLAGALGIDKDTFEATVATFNQQCQTETTDEWGRKGDSRHEFTTGPYYGVEFSVGVHYCMGGLKINTNTQVINTSNQTITGLYAAGEVTGGVQGSYRVDGSALADTLVFGRQAGTQAAAYALAQGRLPVNTPSEVNQGSTAKGNFTNGTFAGTGNGRNGPITVTVTVVNKSITNITVVSTESPIQLGAVEKELIPAIIRTQSIAVDTISGATYSSVGVITAVKNALGI
ncbi:flavocytochrome c [Spirochaetia bacterium]|nr:flavocytochrome c [Spirochaetia bacterium]